MNVLISSHLKHLRLTSHFLNRPVPHQFELETEPRNPRFSKDLLNLRKIQDTLAKMKKYSEAGKTKQQADILEAKEREAWSSKRETKIRSLEEQFLHKQSLEMTGLTKRIVPY
eukprot:symbB.v1.2.039213.t1/scaffold6412.1/size18292/2